MPVEFKQSVCFFGFFFLFFWGGGGGRITAGGCFNFFDFHKQIKRFFQAFFNAAKPGYWVFMGFIIIIHSCTYRGSIEAIHKHRVALV